MNRCLMVAAAAWLPTVAHADNPLVALPPKHWDASAAAHLLRRAGFDAPPAEIERLAAGTVEAAVAELVDFDGRPPVDGTPVIDPLLTRPQRLELRGLTESRRQLARQARRTADRLQLERIRSWWLDRMVRTSRPLEEKMVLFWHGHFTSGYREVRSSYLLYRQNQLFRTHALGNFRELLLRISSDPAMLLYLDSAQNRKARPNENYARELLELFTLGEGRYSERDIKEAARAFTGWGVEAGEFQFRRQQHDYGDKEFLGRVGPWNGGDIIDIVLEQPACHEFIATRLWEYFCYDDPPINVVRGLATTFRKSGYDVRAVVRQILTSRGFYSAQARGQRIKSPVQLAVGSLRQLTLSDYDPVVLAGAIAEMGQQLFQPPSVKGWDGGRAWINTATLYTRYNFAGGILNGYPPPPREARAMERMEEAAELFGFLDLPLRERRGQPPYDPTGWIGSQRFDTAEGMVRHLEARLLAVPLSEEDRTRIAVLLPAGAGSQPADATALRRVIQMLMSTPEYQLY